ncbi:membrane-bound lytic murein transglycosylase B [Enterobacter cancerogenus]|uniref:Membrane-bound lytic murein transglycosylase B n=1 Tax=Enterobacter cancerogenus TaxID=69218 RepID=A0A484Z8J9_9ENTR|nr:membrane-bound lytic murein transglycosylase B [Enterobacter cancerogenus]
MLYHTGFLSNSLNGCPMFKRRYAALLPALILLSACSSKPKTEAVQQTAGAPSGGFLLEPQHNMMQMGGDFANNPAAEAFIDKMVSKHGFDRQQLHEILSQAKRLDYVLRLMDRQAPTAQVPTGPNGAWLRYRKQFITPDNVQNGVAFWNQYEDALNRAWQVYGVPPEIIVGIIGVETRWGRVMGKTRILDALATLSFNYPRRAEYFSSELETFLLMARNEQDDPLDLKGSFAGAMGYGQFMPSSYKQYAVDFNGGWSHQPVGSGRCYRQRGKLLQSARLDAGRPGGGAGQRPGVWPGKWLQNPVQPCAADGGRLNADPAAGRRPAGEPAAPGCRYGLSVLVRSA